MQDRVVVLNGGDDHQVVPVAHAGDFLARVLGTESWKRAVVYLRCQQDDQGRQRVGVLVGSQLVGHLPLDTDEGILAAIRACELNEAVPRARGTLCLSWDSPGDVEIKVNLADAEHLLDPAAAALAPSKSVAASAPAVPDFSTTAPRALPEVPPAAHSSWTGAAGNQPATQAGWLASSRASDEATPVVKSNSQTQHQKGASDNPDSEIIAAWGSSRSSEQPVMRPTPVRGSTGMPTWLAAGIAVLLIVGVGLLVWKFVFAPKTYSDPDYGYSFTYPGRWENGDEEDVPLSDMTSAFGAGGAVLDFGYAGRGELFGKEFVAVAVAVFAPGVLGDPLALEYQLRSTFSASLLGSAGCALLDPVAPVTVAGLSGFSVTISYADEDYPATVTRCYLLGTDAGYMLMTAASPSKWEANQAHFERFYESFQPAAVKM